ncbi:MAG: O-antigen ligase family protein [Acidobacteria bacterium]|nr:O-antigen ligase family protein [Acidobacteriota bacterium]
MESVKVTIQHYLISAWPLIIVVPLVQVPLPMFVTGHPWRAELALALYAAALIGTVLFAKRSGFRFHSPMMPTDRQFSIFIAAFTAIGFISSLWAGAFASVVHHTLLWSLYLIFFAITCFIVSDRRLLRGSFFVLGAVSVVFCGICALEYFLRPSLDQTFGFRYARYAEISAALLPLFVSLAMRVKGRNFTLAAATVAGLWLQVLCSQSRTAVIASILGLALFAGLAVLFDRSRLELRRVAVLAGLFIAMTVSAQLPSILSPDRAGALTRFSTAAETDASNSIGQNVRRQFIGVGLEMAKQNLFTGVGADNFGLEYNKYRAVYSANTDDRAIAAYGEDGLPERAHNEYLQVLAESGIIGLAIFGAMLMYILFVGYGLIRRFANERYSITRIAAFAGIFAFLASSAFSSFSFRLGQNGIIFFFLAAVLLRTAGPDPKKANALTRKLVPSMLIISLTALAFFSARGWSQYLVNAGERTPNAIDASRTFDTALMFDPSNASAHFSYGMRLLGERDAENSARQFRLAVDKGINNVTAYSYLITALYLTDRLTEARDTAAEAVNIFPFSVFMQTRLALLESELGNEAAAEIHFAKAAELDKKAAVTWRLLIGQGARAAAEAGRRGEGVDVLYNLQPENPMWAIITEREIRFPEEKFKFPTPDRP